MNGIEAYQVEMTSADNRLERVRDQYIYLDIDKAYARAAKLAVKVDGVYDCTVVSVRLMAERVA